MTNRDEEIIEQLTDESEIGLKSDYEKKDLKERRGQTKQMLYDGSKKLKHQVPKGKRT
ncbi:MAG TPA: hypothetical protein VIU40_05560 [Geobacteraceae bacterium]